MPSESPLSFPPKAVLDRARIETYIGIFLTIALVVFPMTWWIRCLLIIVLCGIACHLWFQHPSTVSLSLYRKLLLSAFSVFVIGMASFWPIRKQYLAEHTPPEHILTADEIAADIAKRLPQVNGPQRKTDINSQREKMPVQTGDSGSKVSAQSKPSIVETSPSSQPATPPPPTADEIAAAVSKRMAEQQPPPPPPKPCRGDDLSACSDADLIMWGQPLVEKITQINERYSAETKAIQEFKGDKFIKGMEVIEKQEAEDYKNCCAKDALEYYKELASRVEGGSQSLALEEWTNELMQPTDSSDWKSAVSRATTMILDIRFRLPELQRHLNLNIRLRQLRRH